GVVPEARRRELRIQLCDALFERRRVKGSHGPTPGGPSTPRSRFRARSACGALVPAVAVWRARWWPIWPARPWQRLYFCPEPQGHGSLRPMACEPLLGACQGQLEEPPLTDELPLPAAIEDD